MKNSILLVLLSFLLNSAFAQSGYLKDVTLMAPFGIEMNRDSISAVGGIKKFMVYQYKKDNIATYLLWYDDQTDKSYCAWVEDTVLGTVKEIKGDFFNDKNLMKAWTKENERIDLRFALAISASFGKEVLVYFADGKKYVLERGQNLDYKYDPKLNVLRNKIMGMVRDEVLK